LTEPQVRPLSK